MKQGHHVVLENSSVCGGVDIGVKEMEWGAMVVAKACPHHYTTPTPSVNLPYTARCHPFPSTTPHALTSISVVNVKPAFVREQDRSPLKPGPSLVLLRPLKPLLSVPLGQNRANKRPSCLKACRLQSAPDNVGGNVSNVFPWSVVLFVQLAEICPEGVAV